MIGGYTLIEPDMETWDDILLPIYRISNGVPLVDKNGNKIKNPKEKWIQRKVRTTTGGYSPGGAR